MLKLYESTPGTPVLSLRTGGPVASIISPIINPNNLFIEGWYVSDIHSGQELILSSGDVRDVLPQGFAINDFEVLSTAEELVRMQKLLEMDFDLINMKVTSESGTNYGKINDYAFETNNSYIQKLYVSQPLIKTLKGGTLSIDRSQIIEVTNKRVIIEDPSVKNRGRAPSPSVISS
jgi:sporulation protein YlmC with PRC-barrel domain